MTKKKEHPKVKAGLHPRNKHRERYDFKMLIGTCPELSPFVKVNEYDDESVNFSDPKAVIMLNKALLMHYYNVKNWTLPEGFLCPPVPGRADYIHHLSDLLSASNNGIVPSGTKIKGLDIGVGANCIYPIVGKAEYGWSFVGSDLDAESVKAASTIVADNDSLKHSVKVRQQALARDTFRGIIQEGELFDFTMCNPPFHASQKDAESGTLRKLSSLNNIDVEEPVLNFGGQSQELCCPGGEERFVKNMVAQSQQYAQSCFWFTTLVSKKDHIRPIKIALKKAGAVEVKTIPMSQGTKVSRFVAWTFLSIEQQQEWVKSRWSK